MFDFECKNNLYSNLFLVKARSHSNFVLQCWGGSKNALWYSKFCIYARIFIAKLSHLWILVIHVDLTMVSIPDLSFVLFYKMWQFGHKKIYNYSFKFGSTFNSHSISPYKELCKYLLLKYLLVQKFLLLHFLIMKVLQ